MKTPDVAGVLEGYRLWAIGLGGLLLSPNYFTVWPAGKPLKALHLPSKDKESLEPIPHSNCLCGIHAKKTMQLLINDDTLWYQLTEEYIKKPPEKKPTHVFTKIAGKVMLWGRTVKAEIGWRAEYAYPHTLYLLPAYAYLKSYLENVYNIKVHLLQTFPSSSKVLLPEGYFTWEAELREELLELSQK